jgi:hypothetical protein
MDEWENICEYMCTRKFDFGNVDYEGTGERVNNLSVELKFLKMKDESLPRFFGQGWIGTDKRKTKKRYLVSSCFAYNEMRKVFNQIDDDKKELADKILTLWEAVNPENDPNNSIINLYNFLKKFFNDNKNYLELDGFSNVIKFISDE